MQNVPIEGTLRRCTHHVYDPDGNGVAHHCGLCRVQNYAAAVDGFHTPRLGQHEDGKLRANGRVPGDCPACGSAYHYGEAGKWVCAECGTSFAPPRRMYITEVIAREHVDLRLA